MKGLYIIAISTVAMFTGACATNPVDAAEMPNLMIMGEDADTDTVPRDSRVFKRVLNALANELNNEGFNVYDETAVSLDDFTQGRVRRTDAEIIDIARSLKRPPIDVATIFAIYARAKDMEYTKKIYTRVEGRLLNVKTGQRLGNFEVEMPQPTNVATDCDRQCVLEAVGKNAKNLSQDLGAVLITKLAHIVDGDGAASSSAGSSLPSAYSLVFNGFSIDEIDRIEEYIMAFDGYKHHRPVSSSLRNHEYWYETQSDSAGLNRNFRQMLKHLGLEGRVTFAGSNFQIEKISLRKNRN